MLDGALEPAQGAESGPGRPPRRHGRAATPPTAPGSATHSWSSSRRLGHGLDVEEHGRDVDAGDAVNERVMGLGDEGEALAGQPLDHPDLPERLRAVELLGEDARRHVPQLLLRSGRRQRRVAHVVLEVERGVVDPERPPGRDRRVGELLAKAGHQVKARADVVEQVGVARRRPFEDADSADVHVRCGALVGEERDVERGQPIHVRGGHMPNLPSNAPPRHRRPRLRSTDRLRGLRDIRERCTERV